jgi:hypothetical protein
LTGSIQHHFQSLLADWFEEKFIPRRKKFLRWDINYLVKAVPTENQQQPSTTINRIRTNKKKSSNSNLVPLTGTTTQLDLARHTAQISAGE